MIFRKVLMAAFLLAFVSILGCETVKGAGMGATEGAQKDWQNAKQIDQKMREELW